MCRIGNASATLKRASVQNGTAWLSSGGHDCRMPQKTAKKWFGNSTRAGVEKEMTKPRIIKSGKIEEGILDTGRIPEQSGCAYFSKHP
jgi:hypothetical protein